MRVWFHKLGELVGLSEPADEGVRGTLCAAAEGSLTVMIEPVGGSDDGTDLEAVVEAVEANALVLRLAPAAATCRLEPGERIRISIQGGEAVEEGEVEVIGRWSGLRKSDGQHGYRVTIPESLVKVQRRGAQRVAVAFDLSPKASIRDPDSGDFLAEGWVLDISTTGLRVYIPSGTPLLRRQVIVAAVQFPEPFQSFHANCEVVRAGRAKSGQGQVVGLMLLQPVGALARTIEVLHARHAAASGRMRGKGPS